MRKEINPGFQAVNRRKEFLRKWGITYNGETLLPTEWADNLGISKKNLMARIGLVGVDQAIEYALNRKPRLPRAESQRRETASRKARKLLRAAWTTENAIRQSRTSTIGLFLYSVPPPSSQSETSEAA